MEHKTDQQKDQEKKTGGHKKNEQPERETPRTVEDPKEQIKEIYRKAANGHFEHW